jgi:pilus assembly protein Flp/PilA
MNFIARLRALRRDDSGQDLLEYALLVALIALVCVAVITSTGSGVQNIFQRISDALANVPNP